MSDIQLLQQINSLPEDLKKQVEEFVSQLSMQKEGPPDNIEKRPFGYAKGSFKMNDDFDAPLKDFSDYSK